ncbi:MAG: sodium-dependent transporter [Candidatus Latescibacteria bacterium]|nr:sodium-dependent transporter [Candidatus Latescibacterota bacterium]
MSGLIKRERWGSKIGVILAVAGSAVGLGNFLRFPVQAAQNGGGAFLIPYFISLVLLGIPLMLTEWTLGRYGGMHGYGTAPSIFAVATRNHFLKYFGVIGVLGPTIIFIWYTYVESWLLGFAIHALFGRLMEAAQDGSTMKAFLEGYQGIVSNSWFGGIGQTYIIFLFTFAINFWVIFHGVKGGIEKFSKIAMPVLFILGLIMMIRVITLGAPNPAHPDWNVSNGFGYLWNPDFSRLKDVKVWMAAAGQVFFTLSTGIGMILTYASYLDREDDVALSSMTSVSINEFVEVILAGSIIIPAAFVFMGPAGLVEIAEGGGFNLGFVTMPQIFTKISAGWLFAFIWFFMLFIAGATSSVSMLQPAVAFVDDEFKLGRKKAVIIIAVFCFIACNGVIIGLSHGVLDELDFWSGTFSLVVLATIEAIIFSWVFGIDRAWKEIHHGADIQLPWSFRIVLKYVTPTFLLILLGVWTYQLAIPTFKMVGVQPENKIWVLGTRLGLVAVIITMIILVYWAWRGRPLPDIDIETDEENML